MTQTLSLAERTQGTPEWLALRRKKVSASDAAPVMGANPWKSNIIVWKQKLGLLPEDEENEDMKRGRELEPIARNMFEKLTDFLMVPKVVLHPTIDYMLSSLDGMEISGKAILEIKCPRKHPECVLDGEVPVHHMPQLQHQMITTGLKKAYYFSYTSTSHKLLEVYLDEEYAKDLLKKEAEFWHCVTTKTEPKIENKHIHMTSKEWNDAATEWREIQRKKSLLESEEKACKDRILRIALDQNAQGCGIKLSKQTRRGTIDMELVRKSEKIDLEKYRKPSTESWRIS